MYVQSNVSNCKVVDRFGFHQTLRHLERKKYKLFYFGPIKSGRNEYTGSQMDCKSRILYITILCGQNVGYSRNYFMTEETVP